MVIFPAADEERLALIREAASSMQVVNAADEETAKQEIKDADAFFGKITPALLENANSLRWVQSPTASLEHYIFDELVEHPCRLSNMRGIYSDVIADHVMGYVLCFARNLHLYLKNQSKNKWAPVGGESQRSDFVAGPSHVSEIDRRHLHLSDCTMGVVGVGHIGAEICRRADAFGMTILGIDPVCREVPSIVADVWQPDQLPQLLEQSDFVVIAAPHTPETYKLFGRDQFQQMKSTAYLVNIGRGVIVDLAEVTNALENGEIAGAALDVFEIEPLPSDHALWNLPNVIITPHIAAASTHIARRHTETLLENIRKFVVGEDPLTLVDKRQWF